MTLAFEKFMKQHRMTGSEKADGYSSDAFVGLEDGEKEAAFELLATELPWSAEWIFLVDPERALVVAREMEEKLRGDPCADVYMLQEQLVKHSGHLIYQQHMIEDYPTYINKLRPLVVDSVGRIPANKAACEFFKQVILVEVNSSAVVRASRHLLSSLKVPHHSEGEEKKYRQLMDELRSDNFQVKKSAIAELEKYGYSMK